MTGRYASDEGGPLYVVTVKCWCQANGQRLVHAASRREARVQSGAHDFVAVRRATPADVARIRGGAE